MTMQLKKEILGAIMNGDFYNWLCNNALKLSHYELTTILKEFAYVFDKDEPCELAEDIVDSLIDYLDAE